MNKIFKYTKILLIAIFCLSLSLLFVACGDTQKTYTVTFDAGAEVTVASQTISHGQIATIPDVQGKFGYKIAYWKNGDSIYNFSTPVTQNLTLVAEWMQYIYVTDNKITGCLPDELPSQLIIPGDIQIIGKGAFKDCLKLSTVTISSGVTSIEEQAFSGCFGLGSITIPNSVVSIGSSAFAQCALSSADLPDSLTNISDSLFSGCSNLQNITIPSGVTSIGGYAFFDCDSLTSVTFDDESQLEVIGERAFANCNILPAFVIPDGVTSIGDCAFYYCSNLASVILPDSITQIGRDAFSSCNELFTVVISDLSAWCNITFVNEYSNPAVYGANFYVNNDLVEQQLVIPDGVTNIKDYAFCNFVNITDVTIPNSVTSIGAAFASCDNLSTITFANDSQLETIGKQAFEHSALAEITIPSSVTTIDDSAFFGCAELTSIEFEQNSQLQSIGQYAISWCENLESIAIPDSVTKICENAFSNCANLTTVTFGQNSQLDTIEASAFVACEKLSDIAMPDSMTNIGDYAFSSCKSLKEINIPVGLTEINMYAFQNCGLESIFIPDNITKIERCAFLSCDSLESITFGENSQLSTIGESAFDGCDNLSVVEIPVSITKIGSSAFYLCEIDEVYITDISAWCGIEFDYFSNPLCYGADLYLNGTKVIELVVPDSLQTIGDHAFYNYSSLKEVVFGENSQIETIGYNAFANCTGIETITIPDSVTSIKSSAFAYCTNLQTITFGADSQLQEIGAFAFDGCTGIEEIGIPAGVTTIGNYAFSDCDSLVSIVIPTSVANMGGNVFDGCMHLTIYCEAENQSTAWNGDWANNWATDGFPVYWGVTDVIKDSQKVEYIVANDSLVVTGYSGNGGAVEIPSMLDDYAVTAIGEKAFSYCENIASIKIPQSVTTVGDKVFGGCTMITIYCQATSQPSGWSDLWNSSFRVVYWGVDSVITDSQGVEYLVVDENAIVTGYSGDNSDVQIPSSIQGYPVTAIGEMAFNYCDKLESIKIPESIATIDEYAFWGCSNLASIFIPDSVATIKANAFSACEKLIIYCQTESMPVEWDNFWTVGSNNPVYWGVQEVMADSYGIEYIVVDDSAVATAYLGNGGDLEILSIIEGYSVTAIGDYAFSHREEIVSVSIPASVTSIGAAAFIYCPSLETVTFGQDSQLVSIGTWAFQYCTNLANITLPDGLELIDDYAFSSCDSLESIVIPDSVVKIDWSVFGNCIVYCQATNQPAEWSNTWCYNCTVYWYSESQPELDNAGTAYNGNWWHYVDDVVTIWEYIPAE